MGEHRVAVVVFCTVSDEYEDNARVNAKIAVRHFLRGHAPDGQIPLPLRGGENITVRVHSVEDVVTAGVNGEIALRVTNRAYPREEADGG